MIMDNKYENIVPWNGAQDTGKDVRLKLERNFRKIAANFEEILAEILNNNEALKDKFVSKEKDDYASGIISFLKDIIVKGYIKALTGLTVGEAIDSLTAGKGIIADNKGRIQADRMELRSSLTVLEIIFHRLSAMESD